MWVFRADIFPPSAQRGDLLSTRNSVGFAEETGDSAAIFEDHFSNAERSWNLLDEVAEGGRRQRPDFDLKAVSGEAWFAEEAGFGR